MTMPKTIISSDNNPEDDVLSTRRDKKDIWLENDGLPVCGLMKRTFHRNVATRGESIGLVCFYLPVETSRWDVYAW